MSNTLSPCLAADVSRPLYELENQLLAAQTTIETWLRKEWQKTPAPLTTSVDLRNAGFKLAPVDTNLFPAGFNNLGKETLPLCIQAAQSTLESAFPGCERLLVVPENHTRNTFYWESVSTLVDILQKAGFDVRVGSFASELTKPIPIAVPSKESITLYPITREDDKVKVDNFTPCILILNHDLSEGAPALLQTIRQPILPPLALGWATRTKSRHFDHYRQVSQEFAQLINIDPWLIDPIFTQCEDINFLTREGEQALTEKVEQVLQSVRKKYAEYGITHKPFVMVKADAGTYGMGVLPVEDSAQIAQLNRKERTRMATRKGRQAVSGVLIQEGVYSFETWGENQAVAEPVVYMLGHHVVGGFYRMHKERGVSDNLNAPGMEFEPMPFTQPCNNPNRSATQDKAANQFYVYGVIARLALLAAARELSEVSS